MDAIAVLKNDHQVLESLFARYERLAWGPAAEKRELKRRIVKELSIHSAIEEQFMYPLVRDRDERLEELALDSLEEHHVAKWILSEVDRAEPDDERFDAKMKVLVANVRHHVHEEETELFPLMRELMAREELETLGEILHRAKRLAPTHPHPRVPDVPPANIAAGMVAKVIDTGRDAVRSLTRRSPVAAAAKRVRKR